MKKQKLNLKRLEVKSFATDSKETAEAKGGFVVYELTVFPPCKFTDLCFATAYCSNDCGPVSLVFTAC